MDPITEIFRFSEDGRRMYVHGEEVVLKRKHSAFDAVPLGRVARSLGALLAANVGLAEKVPAILSQPFLTPKQLCAYLDELRRDVDYIETKAAEAMRAIDQTWEVAADQVTQD